MSNYSINREVVENIAQTFEGSSHPWRPFEKLSEIHSEDKVLYCAAERREDLETGEVAYSWVLRIINSIGNTYSYSYDKKNPPPQEINLKPLRELFEHFGWTTEALS